MSKPVFGGFPREGLAFLRALKKNNTREWFQPRKAVYEEKVKAPMAELVNAVQYEMSRFAPEFIQDASKAIYRIYRDTRFSKDKTPYKTHIAAVFPRRGMAKHAGAGYYFSVSPEEIEVAGGVYMPQPADLHKIRRHIAENHREFARLLGAKPVRTLFGELWGDQLTRVPKGFPADHPAAEHLRRRQFVFFGMLDPKLATSPRLAGEIAARFRAMTPFIQFLNAPFRAGLEGSRSE
jgi:uncharacterized protein (TIGR02453 family)